MTHDNYDIKLFDEDIVVSDPNDKVLYAVKSAIYNGEILTVGNYVNGWKTKKIKSCTENNGTVNLTGCTVDNSFVGEEVAYAQVDEGSGHAMTIVGYNDEIWTDINGNSVVDYGEMGAFKLVNSWGTQYANDGFIWLAYDSLNKVPLNEFFLLKVQNL